LLLLRLVPVYSASRSVADLQFTPNAPKRTREITAVIISAALSIRRPASVRIRRASRSAYVRIRVRSRFVRVVTNRFGQLAKGVIAGEYVIADLFPGGQVAVAVRARYMMASNWSLENEHEKPPARLFPDVVKRAYVGMIQCGDALRFAPEPLQCKLIRSRASRAAISKLHGGPAVVPRPVVFSHSPILPFSHSPFSQRALDLIGSHGRALWKGRFHGFCVADNYAVWPIELLYQLAALAIGIVKCAGIPLIQRCLHLLPQAVIVAVASASQTAFASAAGLLPCRVKKFLDPIPAFPVDGVKPIPSLACVGLAVVGHSQVRDAVPLKFPTATEVGQIVVLIYGPVRAIISL
jgi:hypothetical protein